MKNSDVKRRRLQGFTLIELMIVIAMVIILTAVANVKLTEALARAYASATKGNLGVLRSALSIYAAEQDGVIPTDDLSSLVTGGYIAAIPNAYYPRMEGLNPGHEASNHVTPYLVWGEPVIDPEGGWGFGVTEDPAFPENEPQIIYPYCYHHEPNGKIWFLQ